MKIQAEEFFMAQTWIDHLEPIFNFFIEIELFDDKDTSASYHKYFGELLCATNSMRGNPRNLPDDETFKEAGNELGFTDEAVERMKNLPRAMISKIVSIFNNSRLFNLKAANQIALVKEFCKYVNGQIHEIRLRK